MAARTRQDELRELPLWRANKAAWEPGIRTVGLEEIDCLGIDRHGNLYWDGKPSRAGIFGSRVGKRSERQLSPDQQSLGRSGQLRPTFETKSATSGHH